MRNAMEDFECVAKYELRCAQRYRRYVSVLVGSYKDNGRHFCEFFRDILRESDEVVESGSEVTLLMAETDQEGARAVMRRLKERYEGFVDVHFGAASYPVDGHNLMTLLSVARRRLGYDAEVVDESFLHNRDDSTVHE